MSQKLVRAGRSRVCRQISCCQPITAMRSPWPHAARSALSGLQRRAAVQSSFQTNIDRCHKNWSEQEDQGSAGRYHVANLSGQCAAHGHLQGGLSCRVYSVEQQIQALIKVYRHDVDRCTKTGQSRDIRGSAGRYHVANLSRQYAAHGHTQQGLSCRVYSAEQQF